MAAAQIGPCVVKAQVPAGKRGKAGGIKLANTPKEAEQVAGQILGMRIGDYTVERLLVEQQAKIVREFYAAVLHDTTLRKPLILFSTEGGMDIEEIAAEKPKAIRRLAVDIDKAPSAKDISGMLAGLDLGAAEAAGRRYFAKALRRLPRARRRASGDQSAGAARRRARGRARLQIRARRCGDLSAGGYRRRRRGFGDDRPGAARRRRRASSSSNSTAMSACWRTAPASP